MDGAQDTRTDVDRFLDMIQQFDPQMRSLAYRLVGDRDSMDDVLQEAYLKAFRGLDSFQERSSPGTWLYRIVYNTCIDELRRRSRRPRISVPGTLQDWTDPSDRVDLASALETALARLSVDDRALVLMVDRDGLTYQEASEILDIPLGTIASRLHRARTQLRRVLGGAQ